MTTRPQPAVASVCIDVEPMHFVSRSETARELVHGREERNKGRADVTDPAAVAQQAGAAAVVVNLAMAATATVVVATYLVDNAALTVTMTVTLTVDLAVDRVGAVAVADMIVVVP